ncbi:MAG: site-specific integrase [Desulfovibrionales bacterium]|nr:site-specific integrase [Desulfovibrionales bacterium]
MSWTEEHLPEEIQFFLAYLDIEKGYSQATISAYGTDLLQFEKFLETQNKSCERPLEVIKSDIHSFLVSLHQLDQSKSSVARKLSSLRSFFRFLLKNKKIKPNPCQGVRNPKQDKPQPEFLNVDQALSLVDSSPEPSPRSEVSQGYGQGTQGAPGAPDQSGA